MNPTERQALLLKQPGSYLGDLLAQGLAAAGVSVMIVSTPYDLVVEAERAAGTFTHIVARVDYFGRDEFRLIPLVRREWPDTVLAAYHSPGFEHKGLLADLVGADFVLAGDADVSRFLETLCAQPVPARPAQVVAPLEEAAPQVVPPQTEAPRRVTQVTPASPVDRTDPTAFASSLRAALAHSAQETPANESAASPAPVPPAPPPAAARQKSVPRPAPLAPDAEPVVELTEEELRMLLRQEDDE